MPCAAPPFHFKIKRPEPEQGPLTIPLYNSCQAMNLNKPKRTHAVSLFWFIELLQRFVSFHIEHPDGGAAYLDLYGAGHVEFGWVEGRRVGGDVLGARAAV